MDILFDVIRALGTIVAAAVAVLVVPLIFMIIFSLVSGFDDRVPDGDTRD